MANSPIHQFTNLPIDRLKIRIKIRKRINQLIQKNTKDAKIQVSNCKLKIKI